MDFKAILKTINDSLINTAKSLKAWDTDTAVELLTKQAEQIHQLIEKSETPPTNDPQPEPSNDNDPWDNPPESAPIEQPENSDAEDTDSEPIVKTVPVQLTKSQAEWLQKFVEMYISAWDVADFVEQFEEIKTRLAQIEKQSTQLPESPQEVKKSSLDWILSVQ